MGGQVANYTKFATEQEGVGFEGIDARSVGKNKHQIAVVYEGGFKEKTRQTVDPFVLTHSLTERIVNGKTVFTDNNDHRKLVLNSKQLSNALGVPATVAVRAPGIAWYQYKEKGVRQWGYLILLSISHPDYHDHVWLCRVRGNSRDYFDLRKQMGAAAKMNWEGLCFTPANQVLLAAENGNAINLYLATLPKGW